MGAIHPKGQVIKKSTVYREFKRIITLTKNILSFYYHHVSETLNNIPTGVDCFHCLHLPWCSTGSKLLAHFTIFFYTFNLYSSFSYINSHDRLFSVLVKTQTGIKSFLYINSIEFNF